MRMAKKLRKKLFVAIFILIIILIVLLIIDFNFIQSFKDLFRSSELIVIKDNCGLVLQNFLHDIKSEDNCKIRCYNECVLKEKSFVKVEFLLKNNSCNECNCYCK